MAIRGTSKTEPPRTGRDSQRYSEDGARLVVNAARLFEAISRLLEAYGCRAPRSLF